MKVVVKSFGCSANFAEGEMIKGQLSDKLVAKEEEADAVVLNVCTVRGEQLALKEIRKIKQKYPKKKLVVTGCVTPSLVEPIKQIDNEASILNTHNVSKIKNAVSEKVEFLDKSKDVKLQLPRVRENPIVGIVPICSGCLDACAYCSTRLVKGMLFSYPSDMIESEVRNFVEDGCKEIWITGQDTCCYGFDIGTNLAELLKKIVSIPGDFMVRVGMGNPRHITKYKQELLEVFKHPKIFKFIHIPVQSGNNEVLKRMKRGHDVELFVELVKSFREVIPEVTISTDIILGYPGEMEEEFQDTIKLVESLEVGVLNFARFVSREGTEAAKMDQINEKEKKRRSRIFTDVYSKTALAENKKWIGWEGSIVIDEHSKNNTSTGRNYAYKPVVVKGIQPIGQKMNVKIVDATRWALHAE